MKKILFATIAFCLISCNNNESSDSSTSDADLQKFKKDWLSYDITNLVAGVNSKVEKTTKAYTFSKADLNNLFNNNELNKIRFVLGVVNNDLDIKVQGFGSNSIGILNSEIFSSEKLDSQVSSLSTINSSFNSDNKIVMSHVIDANSGFEYINDWKYSINLDNINNTVSYDGNRIEHFSIEKEVVEEIMNFNGFEYLGVILGVNESGKLTTVLVGMDQDHNVIISSSQNLRTGQLIDGAVFDRTDPCPSVCDPSSPLLTP